MEFKPISGGRLRIAFRDDACVLAILEKGQRPENCTLFRSLGGVFRTLSHDQVALATPVRAMIRVHLGVTDAERVDALEEAIKKDGLIGCESRLEFRDLPADVRADVVRAFVRSRELVGRMPYEEALSPEDRATINGVVQRRLLARVDEAMLGESPGEALDAFLKSARLLGVEIVKAVPLSRFTWRDEVHAPEDVPDRSKLGFVAQDVDRCLHGLRNFLASWGPIRDR